LIDRLLRGREREREIEREARGRRREENWFENCVNWYNYSIIR